MPPSPPTHAEPAAAADPRAADPWAGAGAAKRRLQGNAPPPNGSECIDSSIGRAYRGTTSETADGTACQSWSTPTHFQYSPANYPGAGLLNSAHCRNPSGAASGPWCVTADATSCPVIFGDHCWSIDQPDTILSVDGAGVLELGSTASTFRGWCADGVLDATGTTCCPAGCGWCGQCGGCHGDRPCVHNNDGTCLQLNWCNVCCDESTLHGGCAPGDSYGLNCIGYVQGAGLNQMACCSDGSTMDPGSQGDQCCTGQIQDTCATDADVACVLPESSSRRRMDAERAGAAMVWMPLPPAPWTAHVRVRLGAAGSSAAGGFTAYRGPDGAVAPFTFGVFADAGGDQVGFQSTAAGSQTMISSHGEEDLTVLSETSEASWTWARISQSDDGTLWTAWHADGANSITPPVAGWTLSSRVAFHADAAPDRLALFQTTGGSEASTIEFDGFELSCAGGAGGASCFEAPVGACAVPMCDPIDCKADEAGFTYEGTADKTVSGQACLGWTNPADQTYFDPFDPDVPSPFDAAEAPPAACRNLWNVSSGPWCVTESPRAGGDASGPICTPGQGQNSEVHDAFSHADTGSTPDTAVEGCLAKCAEDPECAAIDVTSAVVSNACRLYKADNVPRLGEPGGQDRQYCLLHAESCLIEVCSPPPPPPPPVDECLGEPSGHTYRGTLAVTQSGYVCQEWTSDAPHPPTYTADDYPNAGLGAHNYCRNPNLRPQGPWCYTTNPDVPWEACDLNRCDGADCKTDVQGADYRGTRAVTEGGYTCQAWSSQAPHAHTYTADDHPNAGLGDHNYCRNPDGSQSRPWCYTTDPDREYQLCDMFLCPSPSAPPPPSPPTPPAPPVPPSPPAVPAPSSPDVTPNPPSAPRIAEVQKQCVVTEDGQIHCLGLRVGSTLDDDFVREQAERRFGSPLANPQPSVSQQR